MNWRTSEVLLLLLISLTLLHLAPLLLLHILILLLLLLLILSRSSLGSKISHSSLLLLLPPRLLLLIPTLLLILLPPLLFLPLGSFPVPPPLSGLRLPVLPLRGIRLPFSPVLPLSGLRLQFLPLRRLRWPVVPFGALPPTRALFLRLRLLSSSGLTALPRRTPLGTQFLGPPLPLAPPLLGCAPLQGNHPLLLPVFLLAAVPSPTRLHGPAPQWIFRGGPPSRRSHQPTWFDGVVGGTAWGADFLWTSAGGRWIAMPFCSIR